MTSEQKYSYIDNPSTLQTDPEKEAAQRGYRDHFLRQKTLSDCELGCRTDHQMVPVYENANSQTILLE